MMRPIKTICVILVVALAVSACSSQGVRRTAETLYVTDRADDFTGTRTISTASRNMSEINYDVMNTDLRIWVDKDRSTRHLMTIKTVSTRTALSVNGRAYCQNVVFLIGGSTFTVRADAESEQRRTLASAIGEIAGTPTHYSFSLWLSKSQLARIASSPNVRFRTCIGDGTLTDQNQRAFADAYRRAYQQS